MTRKKKNSKLTFLVIPDANSSVVRFRLSKWTLFAAAAILISIVALTTILYILRQDYLRTADALRSELAKYTAMTADQDRTIGDLQNHIINLSHQAEDVRAKLEEMKALEQSLKGLTGQLDPKDSKALEQSQIGGVAMDSAIEEGSPGMNPDDLAFASRSGLGGDYNEVTNEEVISLSSDTGVLLTDLSDQLDVLRQSFNTAKKQAEARKHEMDMTPTLWPLGSHQVTSGFGYRIDPFTRRASFHSGIDFAADINTPVYATADGVVSFTGQDAAHGRNIILKHTKGIQTRYLHLNKILVNEGDAVKKGQQIALSGNTGRSTGPHLHYEVIQDGVTIDPRPYLSE